jgi:hypothetical protein
MITLATLYNTTFAWWGQVLTSPQNGKINIYQFSMLHYNKLLVSSLNFINIESPEFFIFTESMSEEDCINIYGPGVDCKKYTSSLILFGGLVSFFRDEYFYI